METRVGPSLPPKNMRGKNTYKKNHNQIKVFSALGEEPFTRIFSSPLLQFLSHDSPSTKGRSILGVTIKVRVSVWTPICNSMGSVMNVAGIPPSTNPSS